MNNLTTYPGVSCICDTDVAKSPENPKQLILRSDALPSASLNEQVRFFGRVVRAIVKEYGQAIDPGIPNIANLCVLLDPPSSLLGSIAVLVSPWIW